MNGDPTFFHLSDPSFYRSIFETEQFLSKLSE